MLEIYLQIVVFISLTISVVALWEISNKVQDECEKRTK